MSQRIATGNYFATSPQWLGDSKKLAFVGSASEQSEVWLVPADGSSSTFKLTNGADARYLRYDAATGDILVSGSWGENRVTLRRVSLTSGDSAPFRPEVEFGSGTFEELGLFDVTKNGETLVFSRVEQRGHVWMSNATKSVF